MHTTSYAPQFVTGHGTEFSLEGFCPVKEGRGSDYHSDCELVDFTEWLPDKRLALRGAELLDCIIRNCSAVLNRIGRNETQSRAFSRFLNTTPAGSPPTMF